MNLFKRLFSREEERAEERKAQTQSVVDDSNKTRRDTEAALIKAYRRMGIEVQRHPDWRE